MSASITAGKGFKFEEPANSAQPKTVTGILPVDTYLVEYADGEGKKQVRLVFKPKDTDAVFTLQERINNTPLATSTTDWFAQSFNNKLLAINSRKDGVEAL